MLTLGPLEARIRWEEDLEPYDPGDFDDDETQRYVDTYGVFGCVIETRAPACACCGVKQWEVAESLWSIVGDAEYREEIERDLLREVAAS